MATNLNVTELDFDQIKQNLKNFLKQQEEYTDYDFDGSGLSTLLDVLAYNTHYNALNAHYSLNEAFLDSAQIRGNVVVHKWHWFDSLLQRHHVFLGLLKTLDDDSNHHVQKTTWQGCDVGTPQGEGLAHSLGVAVWGFFFSAPVTLKIPRSDTLGG